MTPREICKIRSEVYDIPCDGNPICDGCRKLAAQAEAQAHMAPQTLRFGIVEYFYSMKRDRDFRDAVGDTK